MAVRCSPTEAKPNYHMSLTDGTDTLGLILWGRGSSGQPGPDARGIKRSSYPRTVTKISQGGGGYSDFELPYTPKVQEDFSGGRGAEDFDADTTRFYDSYRCDTTRGDVICGPVATAASGIGLSVVSNTPNAGIQPTNYFIASSFVATFANVDTVEVLTLDSPAYNSNAVQVFILADSTGSPGAVVSSGVSRGVDAQAETLAGATYYRFYVPVPATLSIGTTYWLAVGQGVDSMVGIKSDATGKSIYRGTPGGSWLSWQNDKEVYFAIREVGPSKFFFFEYKGGVYAVASRQSNQAPKLYYNGVVGVAASNTGALNMLKTSQSLSGKTLTNGYAYLYSGPGSAEETNFRKIISNTGTGSNDTMTVEESWNITHTTSTEFAVVGTDYWTEITGHGMTVPVTDVLVVNDIVYFAQGEGVNIRRGQFAAGSWSWADDGSNKATYLALIPDINGNKKIWLVLASTASVSVSDAKAWGSNLAPIATWLTCGSTNTKITGIEAYSPGGPLIPYILKEDGFGSISGTTATSVGVYAEHPLSAQIKNVRSEWNGRAHLRFDLFLKFSLLDGLESHYDQRLDDIGPNRDQGLPATRRGPIVHMISYAGRFFAAVDGGSAGYSSILCCTRDGSWHEIYRATICRRILRLHIQVIPGINTPDRLWFSNGDNVYWIPVAVNPQKQSGYTYFSGATVTTAWMYCGFKDVQKYFHELTVFAENLSTTHQYVTAAYQTDNETDASTWHTLATNFTTSPVQTIALSASNNVSGRRIRFRLTLTTDDTSITPRIKAIRLDAVVRFKPKSMWTVQYMVKDRQADLCGQPCAMTLSGSAVAYTPENVFTLLDKWADSDQAVDPLIMRHVNTLHDSKYVFVEPSSITPLTEIITPTRETAYIGSFTLLSV